MEYDIAAIARNCVVLVLEHNYGLMADGNVEVETKLGSGLRF
jgi:hypothetical protein